MLQAPNVLERRISFTAQGGKAPCHVTLLLLQLLLLLL